MSDLNKTITLVGKEDKNNGFTTCGFKTKNLAYLWSGVGIIDTTKGIRAMSTEDIVTAYNNLLGTNYTLADFRFNSNGALGRTYCIRSSVMWTESPDVHRACDLLGNGFSYSLSGLTGSARWWDVSNTGGMDLSSGGTALPRGIRVVLTLNSGVQVLRGTPGTGYSSDNAYTIVK